MKQNQPLMLFVVILFDYFKSPNYLYLTGLKAEDLKESLTTISALSHEIINKVKKLINYGY